MIICNQCGNPVNDNSLRFCTECGAQMPGFAETVALPPTSYTPAPQPSIVAPSPQPPVYVPAPVAPPPYAPAERKTNPLPWILLTMGLLVVAVVALVAFKSSSQSAVNSSSNNANLNSGSSLNRNADARNTSSQNGRWAVCKFTPVHVRDAPNLNATIITDISKDQRVRVISQSSNYDTVFVRSLNQNVYDNWSEVEIENTSIHGWVFSGFLE
jgi:hypothetical protein